LTNPILKSVCLKGEQAILEWSTSHDPKPGDHDVVIEVHAVGVNWLDTFREPGSDPHSFPGLEASGYIKQRGSKVSRVQVGDKVALLAPGGAFTSNLVIHENLVMPVDQEVSIYAAAAFLESAVTAWSNCFFDRKLESGGWLLLHAGASNISMWAAQLAKVSGIPTVALVNNDEEHQHAASANATEIVRYFDPELIRRIRQLSTDAKVARSLNCIGGQSIEVDAAVLSTFGDIRLISTLGGSETHVELGNFLGKALSLHGSSLSLLHEDTRKELMIDLYQTIFSQRPLSEFNVTVAKIFPKSQLGQAYEYLLNKERIGKIVVDMIG